MMKGAISQRTKTRTARATATRMKPFSDEDLAKKTMPGNNTTSPQGENLSGFFRLALTIKIRAITRSVTPSHIVSPFNSGRWNQLLDSFMLRYIEIKANFYLQYQNVNNIMKRLEFFLANNRLKFFFQKIIFTYRKTCFYFFISYL